MMADDKDILEKRYERLDRLISILSHGTATIKWADKKIIIVEKIDVGESKIKD